MKNEIAFFESLFGSVDPEWAPKIASPAFVGKMSAQDVFVYVLDASTGWAAAGSTISSAMTDAYSGDQAPTSDNPNSGVMAALYLNLRKAPSFRAGI